MRPSVDVAPVSGTLRVLVVEDSSVDAKLNMAALRRSGREIEWRRVDTADSMRVALQSDPWDVITCDWAMPGFDAPAALALLKETGLDIPFIIVSGTVGEEHAVDAMHAGAHDYVLKDRIARLAPAVERELREAKRRAAGREAAAALLASEARYRRIIETTNQGVWVIDVEGKTTFLNERMAQLLGYTVAEVIGHPPIEFLGSEGRALLQTAFEVHHAGRSRQDEVKFLRRDGVLISALVESSPVMDAAGSHAGAFAMVMDISDRRNAEASLRLSEERSGSLEAQLRQAQKLEAIGGLAGGVAHDFNNILSVILSYSEFITSDLEPDHPAHEDVSEITKAAVRGADLTRQLLAFSRRQVLEPRVLNLNEVVRNLRSMLRRLLSEDVELQVMGDPGLANVSADPGQIEQVLMNLVVNARDAMPRGGTVTIETANVELDDTFAKQHVGVTPGSYVMLRVSDTGEGMDEEVRSRIFDPFFTTKEVGKGTGLGLSTVFGIIRQSGGTLWVESEVGVGTTFRAYLPTVAESVSVAEASRAFATRRGTETILLCEDEEQVRILVRTILTRNGYRVLEAKNGGEAVMLCEQTPSVQLLLTDVVMPLMSGRQLAERLRVINPRLQVLYMSGYTDDAIVRHGILKDDIEFISKPVTPGALVRKVREVLDAEHRGR